MKFLNWTMMGVIATGTAAAAPTDANELGRLVRPILSENCFQCHGPADQEGDLRLDQPNDAIVPGKPEASEVWKKINLTDPEEMMPPPNSHKSLSAADKALIKKWIAAGAVYAPHWSFGPIVDGAVSIDQAIQNRQSEAAPGRLLRRLALDLTGLPPDIEDVERFERGAVTYDALVEKYLASPHYGEHRARYWLDAARYSDTHGLQNDFFRAIWPYRQWVVDAFNNNLPFDQFSTKQLAGDLMPNNTGSDRIATGFLKSNASTHEGGVIQEEYRVRYLMDRTDTVATTWLGLTAGCAACHDHKFDPLTMQDYYSMTAFFAAIEEPVMNGDRAHNGPVAYLPVGLTPVERKRLAAFVSQPAGNKQPSTSVDVLGVSTHSAFGGTAKNTQTVTLWARAAATKTVLGQTAGRRNGRHGWELVVDKDSQVLLRLLGPGLEKDKLGKRELRSKTPIETKALAHFAVSIDAPNEAIAVYHNGKRLDLEKINDTLKAVKLATNPRAASMLGRTSALPEAPRYLLAQRYDAILTDSEVAGLATADTELRALINRVDAIACSIVAKEGKPKPSHILKSGAYDAKGDEVTAATPAALPPMPETFPRNRLGFAQWLFLPENPLTARVAVNRIWGQFFGEGLVKTQNDFGNQGSLPTHTELLDSLAADFQRDWDVKRLVRRIVQTAAYKQSSAIAPGKQRGHRLRLDGEVIRDQALAVSGLLDRTTGGPPVSPYQPKGIWKAVSVAISDSSTYKQGTGAELYRRSIYTRHKRTAGPPIMSNFDAPSRQSCLVQREVTNTPLQALQLMNDMQFVEAARGLAARGMSAPDPLARMFKLATCRDPEPAEQKVLQSLLAKFREADGAAFAKIGESTVEAPGPYVMVATTILNTDEVLCR